jgi:hypothetical protein
MNPDKVVRAELLHLLRGGNAHMTFDQAVANFPMDKINSRPPRTDYTPWHLLEHIRIAQWDVLEFIENPDHISPPWPDGYWPAIEAQADESDWNETIESFREDLQSLQDIVSIPNTDLYAPIPHATNYTIFREMLVVSDHTAYHVGEFAILRQVMATWPEGRN